MKKYIILVGRPGGKRPCSRPRCRWGYLKIDLKKMYGVWV